MMMRCDARILRHAPSCQADPALGWSVTPFLLRLFFTLIIYHTVPAVWTIVNLGGSFRHWYACSHAYYVIVESPRRVATSVNSP
eukprot:729502-Pyramimonas_sp.AAC.1